MRARIRRIDRRPRSGPGQDGEADGATALASRGWRHRRRDRRRDRRRGRRTAADADGRGRRRWPRPTPTEPARRGGTGWRRRFAALGSASGSASRRGRRAARRAGSPTKTATAGDDEVARRRSVTWPPARRGQRPGCGGARRLGVGRRLRPAAAAPAAAAPAAARDRLRPRLPRSSSSAASSSASESVSSARRSRARRPARAPARARARGSGSGSGRRARAPPARVPRPPARASSGPRAPSDASGSLGSVGSAGASSGVPLGSFGHSVGSLLAAASIIGRGAGASVPKAPSRRRSGLRSRIAHRRDEPARPARPPPSPGRRPR